MREYREYIEMGIVVICSLILSNFQMDVNTSSELSKHLAQSSNASFIINRREWSLATLRFRISFKKPSL